MPVPITITRVGAGWTHGVAVRAKVALTAILALRDLNLKVKFSKYETRYIRDYRSLVLCPLIAEIAVLLT